MYCRASGPRQTVIIDNPLAYFRATREYTLIDVFYSNVVDLNYLLDSAFFTHFPALQVLRLNGPSLRGVNFWRLDALLPRLRYLVVFYVTKDTEAVGYDRRDEAARTSKVIFLGPRTARAMYDGGMLTQAALDAHLSYFREHD